MVYLNVSPSLLKRPYIESVCLFFALRKGSILIGKTLDCSCLLPPWLGIYLLLCKKHPGQSRHPCSGLVHIKLWDSYQAMSRGAPHRKPWLAYIAKAFRYLLAELQNSSPINRDIRISFWILTRLLKLCMYLYIYIYVNQKNRDSSVPPPNVKNMFFLEVLDGSFSRNPKRLSIVGRWKHHQLSPRIQWLSNKNIII